MPQREPECGTREFVRIVAHQAHRVDAKNHAQDHGGCQIQPGAHAGYKRQQAGGKQHQGVEKNLQAGEFAAVGDGQHGQAGLAVILHTVQRQGPEMGRRPQENNQKQNQGICRYLVGHGGPAQDRRHGAGGPANHDVLRCQRLQDHGVDHRITDKGTEGQPHGQRVDPDIQNHRTRNT